MVTPKPIRVLHVFGGMDRGGAETAFMEFLRHIDRARFKMDFLVHTTRRCHYDDEIRALGSQIIPCLHPSQPFAYARKLKHILRAQGPYDILHSHVDHFSGYVLRIGAHSGVPGRIAHNHSEIQRNPQQLSVARRFYFALTERWLAQYATLGCAVSASSASSLFGSRWRADARIRILHNGINPARFQHASDRSVLRDEWRIPRDAVIVGHIGSFVPLKNHHFMIETFAALLARAPSAHLIFAGVGPLMPEIQALVQRMGIAERVHLLGLCADIPRVLSGLDLFLFPSWYEGLPLAVLEAQAAGVPCVLSDTITREVDLKIGLVRYLDLKAGTEMWVDNLRASLGLDKPLWQERERALRRCEFDINQQVLALQAVYENSIG